MLQPLLESLDGADDVEALASAAGARDDANSAIADAKRLEDLIATRTSSSGSAESDTRIVSPIPAQSSEPIPIEDLTVPPISPPASVIPR